MVITVFSVIVPSAFALTVDGLTVFQGPGGGNITFESETVILQMEVVNKIYRFVADVFGGEKAGVIGFDCDSGYDMTIINIAPNTLSYTISGAGQQRIYFQGYNKPNTITGGTVDIDEDSNLIVTTFDAGTVTLTWDTSINDIVQANSGGSSVTITEAPTPDVSIDSDWVTELIEEYPSFIDSPVLFNITGLPGPQGISGIDGVDGTDGSKGEPGITGESGVMGPQGSPGKDGKTPITVYAGIVLAYFLAIGTMLLLKRNNLF